MSVFEAVSLPADLVEEAERRLALQELAGQLDEMGRSVYILLMEGVPRHEIRRRLQLDKRQLRKVIDRIRLQYIKMFPEL